MNSKYITSVQYLRLYLSMVIIIFSIVFSNVQIYALALLALIFFSDFVYGSSFSPKQWIYIPVILLGLLSLSGLMWTADIQTTLPQVIRLLIGIMLFFIIISNVSQLRQYQHILLGVALLLNALVLYGLLTVKWDPPFDSLNSWIATSLPVKIPDDVNSNVLSGTVVVFWGVIAGVLVYAWNDLRFWIKLLFFISLFPALVILYMSQARGAWVAWGFILIVILLQSSRKVLMPSLVFILLASSIVGFLFFEDFRQMIARPSEIEGLTGRLEIWRSGLTLLRDFPFTGVGLGMFGPATDIFYSLTEFERGKIVHAHNLILQIGVDLGFPGIVTWLIIWARLTYMSWELARYGRRAKKPFILSLGTGFLSGQTALMVHGMFDAVTWGMVRPAPFIWGLWGLIMSAYLMVGGLKKNTYVKLDLIKTE